MSHKADALGHEDLRTRKSRTEGSAFGLIHWKVISWWLWLVIALLAGFFALVFLSDDIDHMIPVGEAIYAGE